MGGVTSSLLHHLLSDEKEREEDRDLNNFVRLVVVVRETDAATRFDMIIMYSSRLAVACELAKR
jgi:hypothetical protein